MKHITKIRNYSRCEPWGAHVFTDQVQEKKLQERVRVNGQRSKGETSRGMKSWGKRKECF